MSDSTEELRRSYLACRYKARTAGSSFYACFLLLGRTRRRAMEAIYAFMRHTDDLADNDQPTEARRHALNQWRAALEGVLASPARLADNTAGSLGRSEVAEGPGNAVVIVIDCFRHMDDGAVKDRFLILLMPAA